MELYVFGRVLNVATSDCQLRHVILSVRLSAWNNSAPTGRIFMKFHSIFLPSRVFSLNFPPFFFLQCIFMKFHPIFLLLRVFLLNFPQFFSFTCIFMKFHSIFLPSRVLFFLRHIFRSFLSVFPFCPNSLGRSQSLSHNSKVFCGRDGEQAMAEAPDMGHQCSE